MGVVLCTAHRRPQNEGSQNHQEYGVSSSLIIRSILLTIFDIEWGARA